MAIDVNDPLAENLNDIQDVDKIMPGFLKVRRILCLNSPWIDSNPARPQWNGSRSTRCPTESQRTSLHLTASQRTRSLQRTSLLAVMRAGRNFQGLKYFSLFESSSTFNTIFHISYCSHETDGKGIVLTNTTLGNGDSINAGDAAALVINNCHFFLLSK